MAKNALWSNWQCRITATQLIVSDGTRYGYRIAKPRLLERNTIAPGQPVYDWPLHLAGKGWCSNGLLAEAFLKAVGIWKLERKFDHAVWNRTMAYLAKHPRGW